MSDYISRESVLALADDFELTLPDDEIFFSYIPIKAVKDLPAADVRPVVRCGECKHWKRVRNNCFLASCELDDVVRSEDFFCADGEKRGES